MTDYDVILVGGGHNGLACAAYLARSGRKVLVLEATDSFGGLSATREFAPGYSVSAGAQWLYQLNPDIEKELELSRHGLELAARDLVSISLDENGRHLRLSGDTVEGDGISDSDRAALHELNRLSGKFCKLLAALMDVRAPTLVDSNLHDRWNTVKLGLGLKFMGKEDMSEFLRLILINVYDVMQERFDNERLQALLSLDALLGTHMGPRSPNSVFTYLYRKVGEIYGYQGPAVVKGGMGALGSALAEAAIAQGADLRPSAPVKFISMTDGQISGVELENGERISAPLVVSAIDPVATFACLLGYRNVETGTARRVSQIRISGNAAKLHLALDGLPQFRGLDSADSGQRLVIAPDMDHIERAFNHAKYGEYSPSPVFDISIPTVHDPSLAPDGKHVLSAIVQYAPHNLRAGWDNAKAEFEALLMQELERYAPGITGQVVGSQLLTPADMERDFWVTGGHWHHGELSLDQVLMMRPFPGATQHATPVPGLFLCSAGCHPGGNVMGIPGRNAAREIIKGGASS